MTVRPRSFWPLRLAALCALAASPLALGCAEEAPDVENTAETASGSQSVQPSPVASQAPDTGPAANAPALNPDLKSPKVEEAPTGRYGGTLTLPAYDDPKTLNPVLVKDSTSGRFVSYVFDSLWDENGITFALEPALAESWSVSGDGKVYTFKLRQGVKWHDGKPFTADDVVFTYEDVLKNMGVPWDARDVLKIDGELPTTKKVDAYTVTISLPKPFAPFMRNGALPILPKHIVSPWLAKGPAGNPLLNSKWGVDAPVRSIVGTGPFMFDAYIPGERMTFKRNPNYYRVNRHNQPLPYLDKMVIPFLKNLDTAILKFRAGETDSQWLPGKDYTYMKPQEKEGNFTIINAGPDFRTSFLTFNLNPGKNKAGKPFVDPVKLKWFADKRFRQALAYGIDKQAIIRNVFRGLAVEQNSPIFQKTPYYDPTVPSYAYDPAKAASLLAEAGFKKEGTVLKDQAGHEVKFTMLLDTGSKEGELEANMMKEDFAKLGITLRIQPVTFNVKIARTHESKDWEAMQGAWGAGVEPHGVAHLWQSSGQAHVFNLNPADKPHAKPTYPWEKKIDELFDKGAVTIDEAARRPIYNEFQHVVAEEQPMIFLPVFMYTVAVRNTIGNVEPSAYSTLGSAWNAYELYIKAPSAGK